MKQIFILKEPENKISSPKDLFKNIKEINIDYSQENFILFCLDTKKQIIKSKVIFKGGLNSCLIDQKTLFREALINNSCSVIIAHNHPSKDLKPSSEDIDIFEVLKKGGNILDIEVLDSMIFNEKEFYSMSKDREEI